MNTKKNGLSNIIIPNKKINYFVVSILIFGIISGSIFLVVLKGSDKNNAIMQIKNFVSNVSKNKINNGQAIKSSLIINYIFISLIWGLGLSIIGVVFNIFLTYIKGFIVGFSVSSIFIAYSYKGIPLALLYIFPQTIINVLLVCLVTIYSIMFSFNLLEIIVKKRVKKGDRMFKKYFVIFVIAIILSFFSSLMEVYLFPNLLKIIINLYL